MALTRLCFQPTHKVHHSAASSTKVDQEGVIQKRITMNLLVILKGRRMCDTLLLPDTLVRRQGNSLRMAKLTPGCC